ncbi:protein MEMO1-like isoform X2 [Uloborus diversus]|uniref:protein MEMO1-like isoform X2 n=1 Tax=Uloborus diversus TaxID=327109 RepID=UPI00240A320C|nr:protein MEMO1-like isoform X2 [Uloborus diversus]
MMQVNQAIVQLGPSLHRQHAGYRYSGACAAYAYKQVDPTQIKRVFILGPSHHAHINGCALSPAQLYRTPLGDLQLDQSIYKELESTQQFDKVSLTADEKEHSIEMHLPYIAKVMENCDFAIVPVMVGSLSTKQESAYGEIFSKYLADPCNLFVISSDFCHWGSSFGYQFYDETWGQIHQSIKKLDKMGMDIIEEMSPTAFAAYLKKYKNTICGRRPIIILLNAVSLLKQDKSGSKPALKFLKYAQSEKCLKKSDTSVSYAAASLVFT